MKETKIEKDNEDREEREERDCKSAAVTAFVLVQDTPPDNKETT